MVEIPLTRGLVARVDDADADAMRAWTWHAHLGGGHRGGAVARHFYAARRGRGLGRRKIVLMHRELLGALDGVAIDHCDGDGLNNQRANLRLATPSQNRMNSGGYPSRRISQYKGVCFARDLTRRGGGRWRMYIRIGNGRTIRRYAASEVDAAALYAAFARIHHGAFAWPHLYAGEARGG
jgi:hypothetical protein